MNRLLKSASLLLLALVSFAQVATAQGISKKRDYSGFFDSYYYRGPLSITIGGGTALYMGEVSKGLYGSPGMALNLGVNYKLWPRTLFGLEFNYLTLAGKKGDSTGTAFTGTDWGINLYGRIYLIDDIIRKSKDRKSNRKTKPYITAGVGFIKYKAALTPIGAASGLTPVFPVGLGIEFKISPKLQIITEFAHNFTLNDRLDASTAENGKDGYSLLTLKVQYSPFAPKKKQKFVTPPADPNQHREEHQEWRKKKKEEPKKTEEYPLPDENKEEEQPTEENTDGEQPSEDQPTEETPTEEEKPTDGQ